MSLVGLDVGTSRVKAVRFDESFAAVDVAAEDAFVRHPQPGRSEQDLDEVWASVVRVLRTVVARSPDTVELIAITAQGDGCWLVDGDAGPVGPALLWNDNRANDIVRTWAADSTLDKAFRSSGSLGAPGLPSAQLRWLQQHDPERVERAQHLLTCGGWIHAQLTGRLVAEESDAANPFCDATTRRYDPALLDLFGLNQLERLLPPIVSGGDRCAPLRTEAAAAIGVASGTPVVLAPYDVVSTAIGTGAVHPGDAFAVLGTTLCVGVVSSAPELARPPVGMTLPLPDAGYLLAFATLSGTEVLDWAAALLGVGDAAAVIALAGRSERRDVVCLPYLSPAGERSPFLDADVRGSLLGLDLGHGRTDVARGVLDGLTLAVRDCVQAAGEPRRLAVSGGGARSHLWCRAISDAVGVPVVRPDVVEVGARGAVLVAATVTGRVGDLREAVAAAVRPGEVIEPNPHERARYDAAFERFVQLRDSLRGTPGRPNG